MSIEFEYRSPLAWPEGRSRTSPGDRKRALFNNEGHAITFDVGRSRVRAQIDALTKPGKNYRTRNHVLSTNIPLTRSGTRDRNYSQRDPDDVGVAVYFDLDGRPYALACDRWDSVGGNLAAIAAHIDALRGQERWGVADLSQAFAGHLALPPPEPWWKILGVTRDAPLEAIVRAWRQLAKAAHPDAGGSRAQWGKVNDAYESAKKERSR